MNGFCHVNIAIVLAKSIKARKSVERSVTIIMHGNIIMDSVVPISQNLNDVCIN